MLRGICNRKQVEVASPPKGLFESIDVTLGPGAEAATVQDFTFTHHIYTMVLRSSSGFSCPEKFLGEADYVQTRAPLRTQAQVWMCKAKLGF